jgi:hypothetical protein
MALDAAGLLNAVQDHALASGWFDRVNGHEPKSPPDATGLTAAVWVQRISPAIGGSGLNATSIRLELMLRMYAGIDQEPADMLDPNMLAALDDLMARYSGDFELDGEVREVDLLGQFGDPLQARAGYLIQSGTEFRVMDITLPLIVDDLWTQEAQS